MAGSVELRERFADEAAVFCLYGSHPAYRTRAEQEPFAVITKPFPEREHSARGRNVNSLPAPEPRTVFALSFSKISPRWIGAGVSRGQPKRRRTFATRAVTSAVDVLSIIALWSCERVCCTTSLRSLSDRPPAPPPSFIPCLATTAAKPNRGLHAALGRDASLVLRHQNERVSSNVREEVLRNSKAILLSASLFFDLPVRPGPSTCFESIRLQLSQRGMIPQAGLLRPKRPMAMHVSSQTGA